MSNSRAGVRRFAHPLFIVVTGLVMVAITGLTGYVWTVHRRMRDMDLQRARGLELCRTIRSLHDAGAASLMLDLTSSATNPWRQQQYLNYRQSLGEAVGELRALAVPLRLAPRVAEMGRVFAELDGMQQRALGHARRGSAQLGLMLLASDEYRQRYQRVEELLRQIRTVLAEERDPAWTTSRRNATLSLVALLAALPVLALLLISVLRTMARQLRDLEAAQQALEESREEYQELAELAQDAIFVVGANLCVRYVNSYAARALNRPVDEIVGKALGALFPADVFPRMERNLRKVLETGEAVEQTGRFAFPAGEVWLQTRLTPTRNRYGQVTGILGVSRDVTTRVQAQHAVRESQRMLSTLLSNLPGMVYRCRNDRAWTMEFVSEGSLGLTGYSPEELIGNRRLSYSNVMHPDDQESVWVEIQKAVAESRPFQVTYRIRTASGEEKWVWEQGRGVSNGDGRTDALEGFITDITERRRAEQAVRAAAVEVAERRREAAMQRMEALSATGRLAAGVAHEVNNPLQGIKAQLRLLADDLAPEQRDNRRLRVIAGEIDRIARIVRLLVSLHHEPEQHPGSCEVATVVSHLTELVTAQLARQSIGIQARIEPPDLRVPMSAPHLTQVLLNMILNAQDAMPRGGEIRIAGGRTEEEVCLSVRDTGMGIAPKDLPRIFIPFFTTKGPKGSGLGLPVSHSLVTAAGGRIDVASQLAKGTVFELKFPARPEPRHETSAGQGMKT